MDLSNHEMLQRVVAAVGDVRAATKHEPSTKELCQLTRTALDQLQKQWPQRTRERVWFTVGLDAELAKVVDLAKNAGFRSLSSAPCVELISAGNGCSVLVSYYRSTGEVRVPLRDCAVVPTIASSRFRSEMAQLLKRGYFHPRMRGLLELLVDAETGALSLSGWELVREQRDESLAANRLRMLDFQIENATIGRGAKGRLEREHYAPSRHGIRRVFGRAPVLLPVVHPVDRETALASIKVCVEEGVDGIFLINQGMGDEEVLALVLEVRQLYPALWVGLNLLGSSPSRALSTALAALEGSVDGLWLDNALVDERNESQDDANQFVSARSEFCWPGLYFGGVAFKYQREIADEKLAEVARLASPLMDVVCTSGPGTAMAADGEKIKALREGLGPFGALALASGVTIDNVEAYLPYVDAFLVGTGIESEFGVLNRERVRELVQVIDAKAFELPKIPSAQITVEPIDDQSFQAIHGDVCSVLLDTAQRLEDAHILYSRALDMGAIGWALKRLRDSVHVSLRRTLVDLATLAIGHQHPDAYKEVATISRVAEQIEELLAVPPTEKTRSIGKLIETLASA